MPPLSLGRAIAAMLAAMLLVSCGAHKKAYHEAKLRYAQISDETYAVVAEVRAKPGRENELREATLPLVANVRNEPKNRLYFLHEDRKSPGHFVFYEIFASQVDFEAHNSTSHVQAWFARLPELAEGGVTVVPMRILGNERDSSK